MNSIEQSTIRSPSGKDEICAKIIIDDITAPFVFHGVANVDESYTLSFHVYSESKGSIAIGSDSFDTGTNWKYCTSEFTASSEDLRLYFTTTGIYYLYKTQLELGNKDTDWSPSPDDYSTTEQMTAAIELTAESILSKVSSTYTTIDAMDKLTTRVDSAEMKLTKDSLVTTIGSYYTTQSDIDNSIAGIEIEGRNLLVDSESTRGYLINSAGELEASYVYMVVTPYIKVVPGVKYTFSRKSGNPDFFRYSLHDSNKNFVSRVAITSIPSGGEGSYTLTIPSGIYYIRISYQLDTYAKFEKGDKATAWTPAPEDVNTGNVEVGARNLIRNTATPSTLTSTGNYTYKAFSITTAPLDDGSPYTVSADVEVLSGTVDMITIRLFDTAMSTQLDSINVSIINNHIETTFMSGRSAGKLLIYAGVAGSTGTNQIKISNLKFERGNKATDWSPAPEDTDAAINSVKTIATQTSTMFNWLVQGNANDITSLTLTSTMAELITDTLVIKDASGSSTIISGGKMDIEEIFARDITATGTIRGVNLIGATGDFSGSIEASSGRFGSMSISGDTIIAKSTSAYYPNTWMQLSPRFIILEDIDTRYNTYIESDSITIKPINGETLEGDVSIDIGSDDMFPIYVGRYTPDRSGYIGVFNVSSDGSIRVNDGVDGVASVALESAGNGKIKLRCSTGNEWGINSSSNNLTIFRDNEELFNFRWDGVFLASANIVSNSRAGSWFNGMEIQRAAFGVYNQAVNDAYFPVVAMKTQAGHVWNIGTYRDQVGFYGFKSGLTENAYDWGSYWDVTTGALTINGAPGNVGQIRIIYNNYGVMLRNDGDNFYFLITDSGNQLGTWNSFRPFTVKLSTGVVSIHNGLNTNQITFSTHGGGWTMIDAAWLRTINNAGVYSGSGTIRSDSTISCGAGSSNSVVLKTGYMEMYGTTPFIDFHFNNSTADHTSRIIESASGQLSVNGSSFKTNQTMIRGGSYGLTFLLSSSNNHVFRPTTTAGDDADNIVYLGAGASRFYTVYATNGVKTSSDERDKNVFGLDRRYKQLLMSLRAISYTWKDDDVKTHIGVSAQQTEKALIECGFNPDMFGALEHDFWDIPHEDGRTDRYSVNYDEIAMLMLPVVQDHETRLNDIESENESYRTVIDELIDENTRLKKRVEQLENKLTA